MDGALGDLAIRITELRKAYGFSQEQLARRLRVSQSWLSQVERGRRPPSRRLAQRLEKILKLERGDLTKGIPFKGPGRPRTRID